MEWSSASWTVISVWTRPHSRSQIFRLSAVGFAKQSKYSSLRADFWPCTFDDGILFLDLPCSRPLFNFRSFDCTLNATENPFSAELYSIFIFRQTVKCHESFWFLCDCIRKHDDDDDKCIGMSKFMRTLHYELQYLPLLLLFSFYCSYIKRNAYIIFWCSFSF